MQFDLMNTQRTIQNDPDLTASQKAFLFVAARCTDNGTSKVRNSQENLAHYSQINFKTVSKWLTKHEEVRKYFLMEKRGRMLDLWFKEEVPLTASLYDTLPSKLRDEVPNTPSEVEYQTVAEQSQSDTPSEMTNTPSEIPDTPSEIPDTPSEVEPSTITSTLSSTSSSTNKAVADATSLNSRDNEEQGEVVENVVSCSSDSSLESIDTPSLDVVDSSASSLVLNTKSSAAPAAWDTNLSWDTEKETRPAQEWEDMTNADFFKWFEEASETEQDVAAYGYEHRKHDSLEMIYKTAKEAAKSDYNWCGSALMKYTYANKEVDAPTRNRTKELEAEEAPANESTILDEEW